MCVCVCWGGGVVGGYNPEVFLVGVAGQASLPGIRRILEVLCPAGLRPLKTLRQRNELPLQVLYSLQKVFARTNSWPLQNYRTNSWPLQNYRTNSWPLQNYPDKFMAVKKLPGQIHGRYKITGQIHGRYEGICLDKFKSIETSMAVFSQGTVSTAGCLVSYGCQWL